MAFGENSRFGERHTRTEPTKSMVVGLLCAALGRPRSAPVNDLSALPMAIRVDQEGTLLSDFQTTQDVIESSAKNLGSTISNRYYLADANFLVGLEGKKQFLNHLDIALQFPKWQLFAGRKAFPYSCPVASGVSDLPLMDAIAQHPYGGDADRLRVVREVPNSLDVRQDVPISMDHRTFSPRCVQTLFLKATYHGKALPIKTST